MSHGIKQIIGRKAHIDNCLDWLAERGWILRDAYWSTDGLFCVNFQYAPRDSGKYIYREDTTFSEAVNKVIRQVAKSTDTIKPSFKYGERVWAQ